MSQRVKYYDAAPAGLKIMREMETYLQSAIADSRLRELIKIRASQLNGCAYCIDMHTRDARKLGETEQRIYGLNAWEECLFYSPQEKAALRLTEHLTHVSTQRVGEEVYREVRTYFNEEEYVNLVLLINQINSWNRISIAMGLSAGTE